MPVRTRRNYATASKMLWVAIPLIYVLVFKLTSVEAARPLSDLGGQKYQNQNQILEEATRYNMIEDTNPVKEVKMEDVENKLKKNKFVREFNSLTDILYEVYIKNSRQTMGNRYRSLGDSARQPKLRYEKKFMHDVRKFTHHFKGLFKNNSNNVSTSYFRIFYYQCNLGQIPGKHFFLI